MLRTTHIRTKLALALAVPLLALMAIAGYQVLDATRDVDDAEDQTSLAATAIGPGSLLASLQDERNRAAIDLIGLGDAIELAVDTNDEARARVDAAANDLRSRLRSAGPVANEAFAPAFEALGALEVLRADIDADKGPFDLDNNEVANAVFDRYTTIIETFFDATSTLALSLDAAELRNGVDIIDAATRQSEMRARIVRAGVLAAILQTLDEPETTQAMAALHDRARGFDEDIQRSAVGPYEGIAGPTFAEPNVQGFNTLVETYLEKGTLDVGAMLSAVDSSDPTLGYQGLRARATDALGAEANRRQDEAVARQRLFGAVGVGGLLIAVLLTWLASRSITRPLKSLKEQAETMAGTTLPAAVRAILDTPDGDDVSIPAVPPISVRSRDEVAGVAKALSTVQTSALDLAVEQAVLRRNISDSYVNLGRRNQNLLSRQLDLITDLERNESDPDALEGLFRLDHLATRMRRNAESLLVLAGIEPPRQWAAPVKISDLVRAALGEVEDYQRVVVRHLEPAALTGAVAADVAHVMAELVENALSFSPPDQSVEVKGRLTTTGYTVAITDNGLGMSPEDLARANRRLAGHESFTVAPSRYLGHYVAGHLASRLGVVVELQASPAGGTTARVDIPMGLLANEETDPRLVGRRTEQPAPVQQPAPAAPPAPSPVSVDLTAAPETESPAPSFTDGGLPRRAGDRPAPDPVESRSVEPAPVVHEPRLAPPSPAVDLPAPRPEPVEASSVEAPAAWFDQQVSPPAPPSLPPLSIAEPPAARSDDLSSLPPPPPPPPPPAPVLEQDPIRPRSGTSEPAHLRRDGEAASPLWSAEPQRAPLDPWADAAPAELDEPAAAIPPVEPAGLPARGFGGLPVGGDAAVGEERTETTSLATSGLTRRVPGAQRPDAPLGNGGTEVESSAPQRTTPEDVYAFLSNFQSGVARGRAEAQGGDRAMEDDR